MDMITIRNSPVKMLPYCFCVKYRGTTGYAGSPSLGCFVEEYNSFWNKRTKYWFLTRQPPTGVHTLLKVKFHTTITMSTNKSFWLSFFPSIKARPARRREG